jgi:glycosyltransferase involved in cell wall biosynthesis
MSVGCKLSDDWSVLGPFSRFDKALARFRPAIGALCARLLKTNNTILHSPALLPSRWPKRLANLKPDILHLHWICGEVLSIPEIGRLPGPVVWTLHDMWPFGGAEHYTEDFRWREGYMHSNRPAYESGVDLNRWVWERKRKYWKRPFHIVPPSRWLGQCVRESAVMKEWPVTVIPNALNTNVWTPVEQGLARRLLELPLDTPLVLFGAIGGSRSSIKGFDLLREALRHLRDQRRDLHLAVFGQSAPKDPEDLGFPVHYLGHLHDDLSLRVLYSAADVMVIPSRQDNLPNTGVESLSCGTPVVAFDTCGLPDIVSHMKSGYLARSFDAEDLAAGIEWVLADSSRQKKLSRNARVMAVERFSEALVVPQYLAVYEKAIAELAGF